MLKKIYKGENKPISSLMVYRNNDGDKFKLKLYLEDELLYSVSVPPTITHLEEGDREIYVYRVVNQVSISSDKSIYLDVSDLPDNVTEVEVIPVE